jgi:hypothetical protein
LEDGSAAVKTILASAGALPLSTNSLASNVERENAAAEPKPAARMAVFCNPPSGWRHGAGARCGGGVDGGASRGRAPAEAACGAATAPLDRIAQEAAHRRGRWRPGALAAAPVLTMMTVV